MQINTEKFLGSSLKQHVLSLRFMNYHLVNVDPLSRNKFSKLAVIVLLLLALSVMIAKT